jgi:hypothetical protein
MKNDWEDDYEMREEYDFSKGIKNPYFQDFRELNLVSLDEDVKAAFPDSEAVNTALRGLMKARTAAEPFELKKAS